MNRFEQAEHERVQAVVCLVRASEALVAFPMRAGDIAAALLWCGRAMLHIAEADIGLRGYDIAVETLRGIAARKGGNDG